jgi:DNA-binding NarL/FixJ family response regulator
MHGIVLGGEEVPMLTTEVDLPKLTRRQKEVLSLLVGGKSNKDIARVLHIAQATTKIHMAALVRALGVRNRTEAAFKAGKPLSNSALAGGFGQPHGNIWGAALAIA